MVSDYVVVGWMLPIEWATHTLMPFHGIFKLTYYSGGGTGADGCKPNIDFRMALLFLGLIKEQHLIPDQIRFATDIKPNQTKSLGVLYTEQHAELFTHYLLNTEVVMEHKIDVQVESVADENTPKKKPKGKAKKK